MTYATENDLKIRLGSTFAEIYPDPTVSVQDIQDAQAEIDGTLMMFYQVPITAEQALDIGLEPIREFMFEQTNTKDIRMFLEIANIQDVKDYDDIPTYVLIPSFIVSELRTAFIIGFLIYIPFIIIDMVVSSVLMSMGMMMLPPTTISMPFKILLFVMADGWNLIIGNLVKTFY